MSYGRIFISLSWYHFRLLSPIFLDKDKYMLDLHIYANVEIAGNMGKLN